MTELGKLSPKRHGHYYGPTENGSLDKHLCSVLRDFEPEYVEWLIEFGAVYVNHKRQILKCTQVNSADIIRVHFEPKRYVLDRENLRNRVVFENDDFMVINKPSGLPMHPTLDNLRENLISGFETPLYVTHRLDVPTSGLVVVAKTKSFQKLFNQMLSDRKVKKLYSALVEKNVVPQELLHYMTDQVKAPKIVTLASPVGKSFECRLIIYSSKKISDQTFEVEIKLLTGRTHQIRAQLAAIGAPIIGDEMYGGSPSKNFGLTATTLEFILKGTPYLFRQHNRDEVR